MVRIIFQNASKTQEWPVEANLGDSLLDLAQNLDLEVEGACEGAMACSTCHMIIAEKYYNKTTSPTDEEEDLLDITFGVTQTSRLGCQVVVSEDMDGMKVILPNETKNMS